MNPKQPMNDEPTRIDVDAASPVANSCRETGATTGGQAGADSGEGNACSWADLDEQGTGLTVDDFITTLTSRLVRVLRRTITVPYAHKFGLTVSEWRILSVLAHAGTLPFGELVVLSTADKALVSRTLRRLEARALVSIAAVGRSPRKKLICTVTPEGRALHDKVMPIARQRQAAVIRELTPEERCVVFHALKRLQRHCADRIADDIADGIADDIEDGTDD